MTQVKKEAPKATTKEEVKPTEEVKATPESTADVKPADDPKDKPETVTPAEKPKDTPEKEPEVVTPEPEKVTEDGVEKITVAGGEQVLNGGRDSLEGDPSKGIDEKADGAKDILDTQKKAESAIKDGSAGLDPISIAEVQNGLVKDYNSDRPVYATASAATAALKASGKLASE